MKRGITVYKVVIADDELFARDFLEQCINNLTEGFEVVGKFSNGKEVISYIEKNSADVILTDIKMPEVTGLNVAEYIYHNHPHIKVVIISGFQEFDYALQAMKFNVKHYLVKVINTDEFADVMSEIKNELESKNKKTKTVKNVEIEMFLYDLICGMYEDENELQNDFENLFLDIPYEKAVCEIITLEFSELKEFIDKRWNYDFDIFRKSVSNLISITLGVRNTMICRFDFEGCVAVVLVNEDDVNIENAQIEYELSDIFSLETKICDRQRIYVSDFPKRTETIIPSGKESLIALDNPHSKESCVEAAIDYINKNYHKGISRIDVANHIMLNNVYFGEIFKKATGKTVSSYLLDLRMSKAKELLGNGEKIEFICQSLGYKDIRNFRRTFRKYTGFTFDEYRRLYIKK